MSHPAPTAVVVLAAGSGTRMRSKTSKVLHPLCGRSMVGHVLAAAAALDPQRVVAVVGHGREQVGPHVLEQVPGALLAVQETQEGTGHAVGVGLDALRAAAGGEHDDGGGRGVAHAALPRSVGVGWTGGWLPG